MLCKVNEMYILASTEDTRFKDVEVMYVTSSYKMYCVKFLHNSFKVVYVTGFEKRVHFVQNAKF